MTQIKIAEKLKLNEKTIRRNMNNLRNRGIIERVGSTKKGFWRINL